MSFDLPPKLLRLYRALLIETRKRVPYIIIMAAILFGAAIVHIDLETHNGVQIGNTNSTEIKDLLNRVATLETDNSNLESQNNRLINQNNVLAAENAVHIDCVTKLFAQYTRDKLPITVVNQDQCVLSEASLQTLFATSSSGPQTSSTSSGASTSGHSSFGVQPSGANPTPPTTNPQGNNTPPPAAHDPLKVLGIPTCVSLLNLCVTN